MQRLRGRSVIALALLAGTAGLHLLSAPALPARQGAATRPSGQQLEQLWLKLGPEDLAQVYPALGALSQAGDAALAFVTARVQPASVPTPQELTELLGRLEYEQFVVRQQAQKRLTSYDRAIETHLREKLKGDLPPETAMRVRRVLARMAGPIPRTPAGRRRIRGVMVLGWIGTDAAQDALKKLAGGAANARSTQLAKRMLPYLEDRDKAGQASWWLGLAQRQARQLQGEKAVLCGELARLWARRGDVAMAKAAADLLEAGRHRPHAYARIVRGLAERRDFGAAKAFLLKHDELLRGDGASYLAAAQAAGDDIDAALATVRAFPETTGWARRAIAAAMVRRGDLKGALAFAESDGQAAVGCNAAIFEALVAEGRLAEAEALARASPDGRRRDVALQALAVAKARAGALDAALAVAEKISTPLWRRRSYLQIAGVVADNGDWRRAKKLAAAAGDGRDAAYVLIAAAQAQAGNIKAAIETARSIPVATSNAQVPACAAWLAVAKAQREVGDAVGYARSVSLAKQAVTANTYVGSMGPPPKANAWRSIAIAQAEAGDPCGAMATVSDGKAVEDWPGVWAYAHKNVAKALVAPGDASDAVRWAITLTDPQQRCWVFLGAAEGLLETRKPEAD